MGVLTVAISALDENGKSVDWWFAYKVPQMNGTGPGAATGYEYVYYDPKLGKVVTSANKLTMDKGALDFTLDAIFNSPSENTGWVLYNDERPDAAKNHPDQSDNGSLGHTKGVLAFDTATKTALWLLHSWPKFVMPGEKTLPTPKYGQTYLCVSLNQATASAIAEIMINHQEPQVFTSRLPKTLSASDPLRKLTQTIDPNAKGDSHILDFKSRAGKAFKLIAKNRKWGGDFWNQLVGPALEVCIDVETWIRGAIPDEKDSDAPGAINLDGEHETFDIKAIDLTPLGAPWKWPETKDHAKWGIGVEADWVCVGDINRMISQQKRGGGTIAFQEEALWTALRKTDSLKSDDKNKPLPKPPPVPATTTRSATFIVKPTPAKKTAPEEKAPKQAPEKKAAKKAAKKSVKKTVKKSAKTAVKKPAKKATKKTVKKSVKKVARKSAKKSIKRGTKKTTKRSAGKTANKATKKPAKRAVKKTAKKASGRR